MNLFVPAALGLVLLAAPIVWFFLRRPPVPTRAISSLLLARALAHIPQRPRRLPREELLPLALILGALLTVVVVLAFRPDGFDRPIVIVVDDSETPRSRRRCRRVHRRSGGAAGACPTRAPVTVVGTAPLQIKTTHLEAPAPFSMPSPPSSESTERRPDLVAATAVQQRMATLVLIGPWDIPETAASCPVVRLEQPSPTPRCSLRWRPLPPARATSGCMCARPVRVVAQWSNRTERRWGLSLSRKASPAGASRG